MNWYEKLNNYFPKEEMKTKEQFNALLHNSSVYFKDEGPYHIAMYAEFADFVFIDYLWVSDEARGKGIGRRVLEKFKEMGKAIILEVEPIDKNDPDTSGRLKFYKKLDFQFVEDFQYVYKADQDEEETILDVMYYTPIELTEEHIYHAMKIVHEIIHSYQLQELHDIFPQKTEEVLQMVSHQ